MGVILEETGTEAGGVDLRGGGAGGGSSTHELVRDDHVFVCVFLSSLHASSSLYTIYGLTNDTVLLIPSV